MFPQLAAAASRVTTSKSGRHTLLLHTHGATHVVFLSRQRGPGKQFSAWLGCVTLEGLGRGLANLSQFPLQKPETGNLSFAKTPSAAK